MKAPDTSISKRVKNEILMGNCVCVLPAWPYQFIQLVI